jgi:transcriptional/translational regulatory protein YebC/TACO1
MAKVREAINKHSARLSSTSHLFQRTGVIRLNVNTGSNFDSVWETAVENGAEDVRHWESDEEGGIGVEVSNVQGRVADRIESLMSPTPFIGHLQPIRSSCTHFYPLLATTFPRNYRIRS